MCVVILGIAAGPALAATKVNVTISDIRTTSVQVSWTQTQDECFQDYRLQYQRTTAAGWSDDVVINSSVTTSYKSVGYTPDIAYNFRVVDENCTGVQASDPVSFRTLPGPDAGAVAAAGLSAFFILIIVIVVIGAGLGIVVRLMAIAGERAADRALGKKKNAPATPPAYQPIGPPPAAYSPPAYQSGQPPGGQPPGGPPQTGQPAAAMLPVKFCTSCGAPLEGPVCSRCGTKNW